MKILKKKISQYSTIELIELARNAIADDVLEKKDFKTYYDVNFTFLQVCKSLTKRKILNKQILNDDEYKLIRRGMTKGELSRLFTELKIRYDLIMLRRYGDI